MANVLKSGNYVTHGNTSYVITLKYPVPNISNIIFPKLTFAINNKT